MIVRNNVSRAALKSGVMFMTAIALASLGGCGSIGSGVSNAQLSPEEVADRLNAYRGTGCSWLHVQMNPAKLIGSDYPRIIQQDIDAAAQVYKEKGCNVGKDGMPLSVTPAPTAAVSQTAPAATPAVGVAQPATGSRGWLGVYFKEKSTFTPRLANALGMAAPRGVLVTGTAPSGAGELAGLKALDVILAADGLDFSQPEELRAYIATLPAGHPIKLKLWRNQTEQTLTVMLSATPPPLQIAKGAPGYCYVSLPSGTPAVLSWRSSIFPVQDNTTTGLQERGKIVGEQFLSYLQQQVAAAQVGTKGYGICNAGLGNVDFMRNGDVESTSSAAYQAYGAETVDLVWRP